MGITAVGNVHGPGYPLYLMTAKLFSWLVPFGSLAFRVSLYSALFASLTVCLVYWVVFRMTGGRLAGALAALAYGFSYTFWYQTVIPETYSLNAFFIALLLVLALRWERMLARGRTGSADNALSLFALVLGLALTNHFSVIFLLPAFIFFALDTDWRNALAPRNLARMAGFLALGLLPYLYEPAAAFRGPVYNYGDPSTPARWYRHMTVYYQRGGLFGYPYSLLPGRFFRYFGSLETEFPYFWWLGAVGFLATFRRKEKKYSLFLALLFLLALVPVMTYKQIESVLRAHFYYESYLIFSIWIGFAADLVIRYALKWAKAKGALAERAAFAAVALLVLLCVLAGFLPHYGRVDKSGYGYARDMAARILESTERDSVLIVDHDNVIFPCMYLQVSEKLRTDVRVVSAVSASVPGFQGASLLEYSPPGYSESKDKYEQLVERNYSRLPIYTTVLNRVVPSWGIDWMGFVARVYPAGTARPPEKAAPGTLPGAFDADTDSDARWAKLFPLNLEAAALLARGRFPDAASIYRDSIAKFERGLYVPTLYSCASYSDIYQLLGYALNYEGAYGQTAVILPQATLVNPDFASNQLARAYTILGRQDEAIDEYHKALLVSPNDTVALNGLAELYIAAGDYDEAIEAAARSVRSDPNDAEGHLLYGKSLMRAGRDEQARGQLQEALKLDPNGRYGSDARLLLAH